MKTDSSMLSTEQVAMQVGVSAAKIREYAQIYESVSGKRLPRDGRDGWLFPINAADNIGQARLRIQEMGSFKRSLETVLAPHDAVESAAQVIFVNSDEARAIREAGLELESRLLDTLEPLFQKAATLVAIRDLEDRQLAKLVAEVRQKSERAFDHYDMKNSNALETVMGALEDVGSSCNEIQYARFEIRRLLQVLIVCVVFCNVSTVLTGLWIYQSMQVSTVSKVAAKRSTKLQPTKPRQVQR
jgi:hypothetical protein